ncbi:MAG: 1-(5-phosphoribosyl)-5-[(5-phosphoribosylamino)methylideneamino]imidazole-4-carboxamide isomerase [Methanospirillum sp.]|uniref:1-(5-phosphoribosyl)-5-[(5- phosphoribosylamino)methylideneamino]imidazole-4- carboxamide isomerase n=1 Tax=Methanospirillum sp. TaxID=45200 RepID=UPI0023748AE6|nr:1-(5-phosphoribosyl)-5-[(5-phosphoribosylamino)methylideneamino]imidazole-4-carboxamide isomerase [Methanospirillum sp.]MDD1727755.1 1-(5-phosphoribosyl)-5-[(5-phosphoribosylamino)methylideneamino]imidazole-4-carboxamide isomerase [Methanospirillum sp.]
MKVFPAVDILGGSCVQLVQGKRESATIYGNPLTCAQNWLSKGASSLHIVNLDGAFGSSTKNVEIIRSIIADTGVELQLGGGIRSLDDARSWLDTGIDRVILSTFAVSNPECLTTLSDEYGSERIMAGTDARNGQIVVDGWERAAGDYLDWAEAFISRGAGSLLFTNVNVEGLCKGVESKPVRDLIHRVKVPVIVAGGISSQQDVAIIRDAGAFGIVLGSALYSGNITLEQAIEAAS